MPTPMTGLAYAEQLNGGSAIYKLRVLKDFQVIDGCCEEDDTVDFRMPLKGACGQYLSPSVRNVYNKFSVRFFLRIVFTVATNVNVRQPKPEKDKDHHGSYEDAESSQEGEEREESDWEVLERQEAATTVESNFLEVQLTR